MEQTPSQFRLTSMSIDSRFADQYYHGTSDFMIKMPSTIRNVIRIALSSVEVPQVAYVFSNTAGNTCFVSGHDTMYIPDGNYTPAGLATAVTTALHTVEVNASCGYDVSANRFSFATTGSPFALLLTCVAPSSCPLSVPAEDKRYWGLGYNLGFRTQTIVVSSAPTYGTASPLTDPPAYMLLQLRCPDMLENTLHRTAGGSFVQALAKLVLRKGAYQIQFDDAGNLLRKENVFQLPTSISQLRISLVDAYGNLVDMGDTDWSMTFEIMDVVNSCRYNELNSAYGRC